jgi:iron complex outermembrane receptor protein
MKKLLLIILFFVSFVGVFSAFPQETDKLLAIPLQQIVVAENAFTNKVSGITIQRIDSIIKEQNTFKSLGELISISAPVYIKSYGPSGSSTISMRGSSASHTGIYWNEIPLNSPTLGLSNLNFLPSSFAQHIDIQYGGSSYLLGSGNIGGSIHLSSYPVFKKAFHLALAGGIGSFGENSSQLIVNSATEKFYLSTLFQYHQIENNFPFINTADVDRPLQTQTNADLLQYGFMQNAYYKLNDNQYVGGSVWYHVFESGLPASMTVSQSVARQSDQSLRSFIEWKRYARKSILHLKAAYTNNSYSYNDSSINLSSIINTQLVFVKSNFTYHSSENNKITLGVDLLENIADVQYYMQNRKRDQMAVYASLLHDFKNSNWKLSLNARQEFILGNHIPFVPSAGVEGKIWNFLFFQGNVSRNYRLPSLNDLYWVPGGNENLLAESAWCGEGGLVLRESGKFSTETSIIYYHSLIDNWIQWAPVDNNTYWEAQNIKSVSARGFEMFSKNSFQIKKLKYELSGGYCFTKSTNNGSDVENDASVGKQLIYVPLHNANAQLRIIYKENIISYNQIFTGSRFTTSDNLQSLPPYSLVNISFGSRFHFKQFGLNIMFGINNVFDQSYQAIEWMAMPGRNYHLTMKIYFKTNS